MSAKDYCPNDEFKNSMFSCLYWKLSIPQSHCWLASLREKKDIHCIVEDGDRWFTKMFEPIKRKGKEE